MPTALASRSQDLCPSLSSGGLAPGVGGRAPRRPTRRWGPLAISLALHGAALFVAGAWFTTVHVSSPASRSLHVAAMEFMDLEAGEETPALDVSVLEPLPDEFELEVPEALLPSDQPSEECDLPACDFTSPDMRPVEVRDLPLSVVGERRPTPPALAQAAPPSPVVRRPVARPAQPVSRRASPRRGRPLKLVHRPSLMQYYPAEARRRGIEGEALVEIRVDVRGVVVEARIVRSSGSALLDRQALRLMYDYRFAPGDGGRSRVPVNFRLR